MQSSLAGAISFARPDPRRSTIVWAFPFRVATESRPNPTGMNGEWRIAIADFEYVGCHLGIVGMTSIA
ncbi:hypothetical protein [Burkholderia cepacia]|uniref:hypothetical protein n=1 Tax=Burkholderia cepacia TaxID=292 RepID=UPI0011BF0583|nr:hypothetical protein [Burkholderia cepacia]MBY4710962.1 hypothetical protein [Burkholderia cepacia]MBY4739077.1 hypothetical protein [Burkholderia cepacia]MBY4743645.1 hypothetical protein [Burkholderia cepacia]MBY4758620.1 hypothetical protein [Burkholderia cepacia]MBY4776127.1 hypothetical protein [Burkholderia cepacia]